MRTGRAVVIVGALAVVWLTMYFINPVTMPVFPFCPLHQMTGLHCPGCGTMRALHELAHGDVAGAFGFNALTVLALPGLVYGAWRGQTITWRAVWIWTLLGFIVAFGVLRNVPLYPFTLLAPST